MMQWMPSALGRMLKGKRAGLEKTLFHDVATNHLPASIVVSSPDFKDQEPIPARYSADGSGVAPALRWHALPDQTVGLVILVEDADSPTAVPFLHLLAWRSASGLAQMNPQDLQPGGSANPWTVGRNGMMRRRWMPPDPPPGHGPHRYLFQIYALAHLPDSDMAIHRKALGCTLAQHGLAKGLIVGTYERPSAR